MATRMTAAEKRAIAQAQSELRWAAEWAEFTSTYTRRLLDAALFFASTQRGSDVWGILLLGTEPRGVCLIFCGPAGGPYTIILSKDTWESHIILVKRTFEGYTSMEPAAYLGTYPDTIDHLEKQLVIDSLKNG